MTVIVAIIYIPSRLGGWGHIFGAASAHLKTVNPATGKPFGSLVVLPAGEWAYATLALGSALALFMYPHATTGVFAARRRNVIRRNAAMLPAYSLVLGLIALFGYMARAVPAVNAGVKAGGGNAQLSVPLLFAAHVPQLVRGDRLLGDRHRRARPRGHHVDRRGEPVYPQHLQGVLPARRHPGRGDAGGAAGLAADEGRRAGLRARAEQDVLDQPAAARRDLDPADLPGDRDRPVHPLVPPHSR